MVSSYATEPPYLKGAAKKSRKAKSTDARPLSAYIFFIKEQAPLKAVTGGGGGGNIMAQLGAEWKALSDEQKQPYVQLAKQSKAEVASRRAVLKEEKAAAKPPPTAYNLWCKEISQELKASHPDMRAPDVMREAAARWRALPDGEKQRRQAEATATRETWKQQQRT